MKEPPEVAQSPRPGYYAGIVSRTLDFSFQIKFVREGIYEKAAEVSETILFQT